MITGTFPEAALLDALDQHGLLDATRQSSSGGAYFAFPRFTALHNLKLHLVQLKQPCWVPWRDTGCWTPPRESPSQVRRHCLVSLATGR